MVLDEIPALKYMKKQRCMWTMLSEVQFMSGVLQGSNATEKGHGGGQLVTSCSQEADSKSGDGTRMNPSGHDPSDSLPLTGPTS